MPEVEKELKKLILDDDFTSIQNLVNEEINLMSILKVARKELQHSNLLAWLFSPNETHGLGDFFIKEFIKLYFKENEYKDLGNTDTKLSVFDFVNLDFSDIEIKREHENIDLLILSKSNGFCIMIENKIFAKESKGQLKQYREYIEKEYPDFRHKIYIFLSLFEQEISESESNHYVQLTYDHIKKLLSQIIENKSISIRSNTKFILEQYLQTLRTLMNENEKIEKIAKNLYKKYKSAFDLVYKYSSYSLASHSSILSKLIVKNSSIRKFKSSKTYIRFQPNFLYENIEGLKKKGFIDAEDNLENSWIFLFEFHITRENINFDLKIGEYTNQECRNNLYQLYIDNQGIFDKVVRPNKKLSPSWHLAFQRKIVTKSEYNQLLEDEDDSLNKIIKKRFDKLINKDFPKIKEIIENSINT